MAQAEEGPQPVPDGWYDLVVETAESKPSSNQKPMVVAVLRIVTGPYEGKKVWNNFVLSTDNANALGFFFEHMAAFGLDQSYIAQLPEPEAGGMEILAQALIGRYCSAYVGHRAWQGRTRNNLGDIKPYSGGTPAVPAAPALGGFGAPPAPAPGPAPQPAAPTPGPQPAAPPAPQPVPTQPPGAPPAPSPQPQPQPQPQQPTPQQPQQDQPQPPAAPQLPDNAPF